MLTKIQSTHTRLASKNFSLRQTAGFSIVEIMVGMVMGMLGIIVVMQVFSVFEGQKRTTTGGSDAQNAGAIAMYSLERDMRQSGYGISSINLLGCSANLAINGNNITLAPVAINSASIPAGDANTDTLLLTYSNTNSPTEGDYISGNVQPNYTVLNAPSFSINDRVIAIPSTRPSPCTLTVDQIIGTATPTVTVAPGAVGMIGGMLYNLGTTPRVMGYAVRNGSLTLCDYFTTNCSAVNNWTRIADGVVSLRAEYGHDTVTPTPAGQSTYIANAWDQSTPTSACGWARTPAVRAVLVMRNAQYEKTVVTTASSTVGTVTSWAGTTSIDLSKNPDGTSNADWGHYRYKKFEAFVPLRNITNLGVQTGC